MGFKYGRAASTGAPDAEKQGEAKPAAGPRWFWLRKAGNKRTLPGSAAGSRLGTPLTADDALEPFSPSARRRCRPGTPFRASMARFSPGGSAIQQLHAELAAGRHTAGLARSASGSFSRSSPPQEVPRGVSPDLRLQNSRSSSGTRPHTSPYIGDWEQRDCGEEGGGRVAGGLPRRRLVPPSAGVIQRRRAVADRLQTLSALQRGSAGPPPVSLSSPIDPDHAARLARLFFLAGPPAYCRRMQENPQADPPESPLIRAWHLRSPPLGDLDSAGPQPGLGHRSSSLDSADSQPGLGRRSSSLGSVQEEPSAQQRSLLCTTPSRLGGGGSQPWRRLSLGGESEQSGATADGSRRPPPHRRRLSSGDSEESGEGDATAGGSKGPLRPPPHRRRLSSGASEESQATAASSKGPPRQRQRLPSEESGGSEESEESGASAEGGSSDLPEGPPLSSHALATLKRSASGDTDSLDVVPMLQLSRSGNHYELTAQLQQQQEQQQGLEVGVCRCKQLAPALVDVATQTPKHALWYLNPAFAALEEAALEESGEGPGAARGAALPPLQHISKVTAQEQPSEPAASTPAAPSTETAFLSPVSHPDRSPDSSSTSFSSSSSSSPAPSEISVGSSLTQPHQWSQQPEERGWRGACQQRQAEDGGEPSGRSSPVPEWAGSTEQQEQDASGDRSRPTTLPELHEQEPGSGSSRPTPHRCPYYFRTGLAGTWRLVEELRVDPSADLGADPGAGRAAVERLLAIPRLQSLAYARTRALEITETDMHLDIVRLVSLSGPAVIRERHCLRKDGGITEGPRPDARLGRLRSQLTITPQGHAHIRSQQGPPYAALLHESLHVSTDGEALSPRLRWEQRVQLLGSSGHQGPDDASSTARTLRTWQRQQP